jgi:hypothetical protein
MPTLEERNEEYDDTQMSVSFGSVAFSSSLTPGRDLSQIWVVDSACSISFTACHGDFITFDTPLGSSRVGGLGVVVMDSGTVKIIRHSPFVLPNFPSHRACVVYL